jgi:hypothetical protein
VANEGADRVLVALAGKPKPSGSCSFPVGLQERRAVSNRDARPALADSRLVDQVGANAVQRAGVFYVEGSRCDHVKTLPPVCCRASAVQRELTAHNCEHILGHQEAPRLRFGAGRFLVSSTGVSRPGCVLLLLMGLTAAVGMRVSILSSSSGSTRSRRGHMRCPAKLSDAIQRRMR